MRLDSLTGIRALAAIWVVLFHYRAALVTLFPGFAVLDPVVSKGYLGVDLFFSLSGFILAYTYLDRFRGKLDSKAYFTFLRARIARIYPVHLVTLHVMAAALLGATLLGVQLNTAAGDLSPVTYAAQLLMVHEWIGRGETFNYPAWSISAEWFAYLWCPLLLLLLAPVRRVGPALLLAGMAFGLSAWALETQSFGAPGLIRITGSFIGGAALYLVYRLKPDFSGACWLGAAALLLILLALLTGWGQGYWLSFAFGLLVLSLAYQRGALSRFLSRPGAVYWGEVSYALYMTHAIVLVALNKLLPAARFEGEPWPVKVLVVLVYAALTAGVAALMYRVIEVPGRQRLRPRAMPAGQGIG